MRPLFLFGRVTLPETVNSSNYRVEFRAAVGIISIIDQLLFW